MLNAIYVVAEKMQPPNRSSTQYTYTLQVIQNATSKKNAPMLFMVATEKMQPPNRSST